MVSFVGADSGGVNNGTQITNLAWPAGVADGDLALLFWTMIETQTATTPSGFTFQDMAENPNRGDLRSRFYTKICDGTESGTLTLTGNVSNRQSAVLMVLRGTHPTTPVDTWASRVETIIGTTHANPQVTTGFVDCIIVAAISERLTNGTTNWTPPSGYTERADSTTQATGSGGTITAVADDGLASGRPSGTNVTPPVWTSGNGISDDNNVTWTVSVRPAPAQSAPAGTASETDAARPLAKGKARAAAPAIQTSTAQPFARRKTGAAAPAASVATTGLVGRLKQRTQGAAAATDAAQAFARGKVKAIAPATETAEARQIAQGKARTVGAATETATAQPAAGSKVRALSVAVEAAAAQLLARLKRRSAETAIETDAAQPIVEPGQTVQPVAPAAGTETAVPLGKTKRKAITAAEETGEAQPLGIGVLVPLVPALETVTAGLLRSLKRRAVPLAAEMDIAAVVLPPAGEVSRGEMDAAHRAGHVVLFADRGGPDAEPVAGTGAVALLAARAGADTEPAARSGADAAPRTRRTATMGGG